MAKQDKLDALARGEGVDSAALAPYNSYGRPDFVERGYYVDIPFVCQACGSPQTWTAAQQKWWYEVAKGYVYSTASLCRPCRRLEKARREEARIKGGDPNPYKNVGLLLARIRADIEPKLSSNGYRFAGGRQRGPGRALFLDFVRSTDMFTLAWDRHQARLIAERLTNDGAELHTIATAEFSGVRSTADIDARLAPFLASVHGFLDGLREASED